MIQLSPHFTRGEFTDSQIAARLGIDNTPSEEIVKALVVTANGMELVRELLGNVPILISSGYRSPGVNAAAHGAAGSQHLLGEACDFTAPKYGTPVDIMRALTASSIPYDQCILEYSKWVHVSFSLRNRRQALVIDQNGTRSY